MPAKSLFDQRILNELKERIHQLSHDTQPNWGQMDAAQMLAHCGEVMRNAMGEIQQKRKLLGYFVAPFLRHRYYNEEPFKSRNVPSTFKVNSNKDFDQERERLLAKSQLFHEEGFERCKNSIHPMLGKFTPNQWAIGQYKHIDHRLRQFGV